MSTSIDSINSLGSYLSLLLMNAQTMQKRQDDLFSKIDSDSSGGIDKTEFSVFANKMLANSGNSLNVDDVFSQYDVNGDGSLSSDELKAYMKDNAPPPPPPPMQNASSAYGTAQATDQTTTLTTLKELFNKLSARVGAKSGTTTDSFKALISKLIESLMNGGSSSLFNVTA